MNKQCLACFAAILVLLVVIVPGIAGADYRTSCIISPGYQNVTATEAYKILEKKDAFLLDVRTPNEYSYSHIEGAKLITLRNVPAHDPVPLPDSQLLPSRMKELPKNKLTKIVVYCYTGKRGGEASQLIANAGYKRVYNIQNGLPTWVNAGYPVVMDPAKWGTSYPHYL